MSIYCLQSSVKKSLIVHIVFHNILKNKEKCIKVVYCVGSGKD